MRQAFKLRQLFFLANILPKTEYLVGWDCNTCTSIFQLRQNPQDLFGAKKVLTLSDSKNDVQFSLEFSKAFTFLLNVGLSSVSLIVIL